MPVNRVHAGGRTTIFQCPHEGCGKVYRAKHDLNRHIATHNKDAGKQYMCYYGHEAWHGAAAACNHSSIQQAQLKTHIRANHLGMEGRIFPCRRGCGRLFADSSQRMRHSRECKFVAEVGVTLDDNLHEPDMRHFMVNRETGLRLDGVPVFVPAPTHDEVPVFTSVPAPTQVPSNLQFGAGPVETHLAYSTFPRPPTPPVIEEPTYSHQAPSNLQFGAGPVETHLAYSTFPRQPMLPMVVEPTYSHLPTSIPAVDAMQYQLDATPRVLPRDDEEIMADLIAAMGHAEFADFSARMLAGADAEQLRSADNGCIDPQLLEMDFSNPPTISQPPADIYFPAHMQLWSSGPRYRT